MYSEISQCKHTFATDSYFIGSISLRGEKIYINTTIPIFTINLLKAMLIISCLQILQRPNKRVFRINYRSMCEQAEHLIMWRSLLQGQVHSVTFFTFWILLWTLIYILFNVSLSITEVILHQIKWVYDYVQKNINNGTQIVWFESTVMLWLASKQWSKCGGERALVIIPDSLITIQICTITNKNLEHNQFLQPIKAVETVFKFGFI